MSAQSRPAAQQAFETGLVDYFFQMHGKSAKTLREGLDSPRWGQVLQDQLGSHRYQRLNDLVDFMVPLERGEGVPLGEKAGKFAGTWLAHIAGLQIGHLAAKMFTSGSAGSLSLPMKMARVLRSQAEEFFSQSKPSQYIAMAISDPEVYQKLATRMPGGPTEALSWAKTTGSWMRRVQVGVQEGRNAMFDQLADEEEKARRGR
jgi:hypothetical protein